MPDISTTLLFVVASIALLVKPGHITLLVIARSLKQGRSAALPFAFGAGLGDLFVAGISLTVAGVLLATSSTAFTAVKALGALYLVWLGFHLYKSEPVLAEVVADPSTPIGRSEAFAAVSEGFFVTLLNTRGLLFFVAFVPQFIDPARSYPMQATFFACTFVVLAMLNGTLYVLGADRARSLIASAKVMRAHDRASGFKVIAAAIRSLFTRRPAA